MASPQGGNQDGAGVIHATEEVVLEYASHSAERYRLDLSNETPIDKVVPELKSEPVVEPANAPNPEEAEAFVKSFPYWYHRIYLGNGIYTLPHGPVFSELVWNRFRAAFPANLQNASVLDIGCNAGYFAIQAKLRGAGRILGIEAIEGFIKQAAFCRDVWDLDIEYRALDAHQVQTISEQFDVVVFAGILYHLKNPLHVIQDIGHVCRDAILIETEVISENRKNRVYVRQGRSRMEVTACQKGIMKFIEADELNGDGSNWWVPDTECVMGMLRTAGFEYFSVPSYATENRLLLIASKKSDSILDLRAFDRIDFGDEHLFQAVI